MREQLIQENIPKRQTVRYFKFAIGEILLLIIGILIALQVNNLNEKRKINDDISSKINDLVINLQDEIKVSGLFRHPERIQKIQALLDGDLTKEDLRADPFFMNPFYVRLKDDVLEESIDILIEHENILPKRYKSLIPKMKSLKFYFSNYKERLAELDHLARNNEKIMEDSFPWYSKTDSLSVEKRLDYFTTDPFFRNRLYSFQNKYRRTFFIYSSTIGRKLEVLCAVKQADENYTASQYRSYLTTLRVFPDNRTHFKEGNKVDCNTQLEPIEAIFSAHTLINTTSDTINFRGTDGIMRMLNPNSTQQILSSSKDLISIFKTNGCEAYSVDVNNFIIIE